ncbi:MAG TPA: hypothetical protein VME92_04185 [Acetobacteraceae bacterium]|nr:hypothetical protein [Acetobacteraceae bacterium]
MRRLVLLGPSLVGMTLALAGCQGFGTFAGDTFSLPGTNPNEPIGASETIHRVEGAPVQVEPLTPEPGNMWPGPPPPMPTLGEVEREQGLNPSMPPPGTGVLPPNYGHTEPGVTPHGSSTPPGNVQPGLPPLPNLPPISPEIPTPAVPESGQPVQTPNGPAITTGKSGNVQTVTPPGGGGQGILIPNGNGTSTLILPNGQVQTVPTPK